MAKYFRSVPARTADNVTSQMLITAVDDGEFGNLHSKYRIELADGRTLLEAVFHRASPNDVNSVNGVTNEALLTVVLDRLERFQEGPLRCRENALAITKIDEALLWLGSRTADRQRRGVEGKLEP